MTKQSVQSLSMPKVSAQQGNIVWQAGMPDGVILGEQCVLVRKFVIDWHLRAVDHGTKFLILKEDQNNVIEVWNQGPGRGS